MTWHALGLALLVAGTAAGPSIPVQLADGNSTLVGHVADAVNGKRVVEFLGVPFGQPPVGKLRFRKPLPLNGPLVPNPFVANKQAYSCIQTSDTAFGDVFYGSVMWNPHTQTSEDCLYLNLWVPGTRADRNMKPLPVMVWIYGGGYWYGSISLPSYDGRILASEENVIVVAMNYRVTVFGFLYGGEDTDVRGNAGLWDQQLAMKWVFDNIAEFGGNRSSITLFGESAGAASVSLHFLAPSSWPYFHRAILQSGSATAPWALETKSTLLDRLQTMSSQLKCQGRDERRPPAELLKCLLTKNASDIREHEWITSEFCVFPWTPVVDGELIPDEPTSLLQRGEIHPGALLVGSNTDESIYFIVYHLAHIFRKEIFFYESNYIHDDVMFRNAAGQLLPRRLRNNRVTFDAIVHEYLPYNHPVTAIDRQVAIDRMLGDYHFTCNVNEFADYAQKAGRAVYMYLFDHRSSVQTWPEWMGVLHAYEIMFIFGEPLNSTMRYNPSEEVLSQKMMAYWANFARTRWATYVFFPFGLCMFRFGCVCSEASEACISMWRVSRFSAPSRMNMYNLFGFPLAQPQ